jgi:hypothetical protein
MKNIIFFAAFAALTIFATSCKKDQGITTQAEIKSSTVTAQKGGNSGVNTVSTAPNYELLSVKGRSIFRVILSGSTVSTSIVCPGIVVGGVGIAEIVGIANTADPDFVYITTGINNPAALQNKLVRAQLSTNIGIVIGTTNIAGMPYTATDIERDQATGIYYCLANNYLCTININTAAISTCTAFANAVGLTTRFGSPNTVYVLTNGGLYGRLYTFNACTYTAGQDYLVSGNNLAWLSGDAGLTWYGGIKAGNATFFNKLNTLGTPGATLYTNSPYNGAVDFTTRPGI